MCFDKDYRKKDLLHLFNSICSIFNFHTFKNTSCSIHSQNPRNWFWKQRLVIIGTIVFTYIQISKYQILQLELRKPSLLIGSGVPNKCSSASYSLHTRNKVGAPDEDLAKTPGPAAYCTTDNNVIHNKNPVWSLRSRCKSMTNVMASNPAPNAYGHRGFPDKRSSAKFSMGVKHSEYAMPLIIDAMD